MINRRMKHRRGFTIDWAKDAAREYAERRQNQQLEIMQPEIVANAQVKREVVMIKHDSWRTEMLNG